jgi:hypothetical protein
MRKDRLLKLAEFLEALPPERLDMEIWASRRFDPADCGTCACAFGWAATIPEFRELGLELDISEFGSGSVWYQRTSGFAAAEAFFGLSIEDAKSLFGNFDRGRTPKDVARDIRNLIEREATLEER